MAIPKRRPGWSGSSWDALNDHMTGESKRVALLNKAYLEGQVEKNPDFMIRQKIFSLIAQQIETAMMAEVKENFSFKILDPPIVPDRKIRPKRLQMAILALTASLLVAVLAAFVREYLASRNKTQPTGGSRAS